MGKGNFCNESDCIKDSGYTKGLVAGLAFAWSGVAFGLMDTAGII